MQLVKPDLDLPFVDSRKIGFAISAALIVVSLVSLVARGLNLGIDFRGGTLVQVHLPTDSSPTELHDSIEESMNVGVAVQSFEGSSREFLIRLDVQPTDASQFNEDAVRQELEALFPGGISISRVELVGPTVGAELKRKGAWSVFWALAMVLVYITIRFKPQYGLGAILALVHDVTITLGVFALTQREFSLPIVAAVLTIVGYSLNDTIVVYDRIRENLERFKKEVLETVVNRSINETLSRTLLTSLTTLAVVLALFLFGGGVIHDFAFAMILGVVVGTYSSIFVASPVLIFWAHRFGDDDDRRSPAKA